MTRQDALPVDVIVIAYDGLGVIDDCLESVAACVPPVARVIVLDNASSDGTAQRVARRFPGVDLMRSHANLGFAGGVNQALAASTSPLVLLLNQDATIAPDAPARLVEEMRADASIASCAPKILLRTPARTINAAGLLLSASAHPISRGRGAPDDGLYDAPCDVFGAHGACALLRRAAIDRVGHLDADFFAYHEEFDLAWRLAIAGYRCRYVPAAVAVHREAHSLRTDPDRILYLLERNRLWTLVKNMSLLQLVRALPALIAAEIAAVRHCLGIRTHIPMLARWHALLGLRRVLAKRQDVQRLRAAGDDRLEAFVV